MPLSPEVHLPCPHVLFLFYQSGDVSVYEETSFSQHCSFIKRHSFHFPVTGIAWDLKPVLLLSESGMDLFYKGHRHHPSSPSIWDEHINTNFKTLCIFNDSKLHWLDVYHAAPVSFASSTVLLSIPDCTNAGESTFNPTIVYDDYVTQIICDDSVHTENGPVVGFRGFWAPLKAAISWQNDKILLQDIKGRIFEWTLDGKIRKKKSQHPPSDVILCKANSKIKVFMDDQFYWVLRKDKFTSFKKKQDTKVAWMDSSGQIQRYSAGSVQEIQIRKEHVVGMNEQGIHLGTLQKKLIHWVDHYPLSAIQTWQLHDSTVFVITKDSFHILTIQSRITSNAKFPLTEPFSHALMAVSSSSVYCSVLLDTNLYLYFKHKGIYECIYQGRFPCSEPVLFMTYISYTLVIVTTSHIYKVADEMEFHSPGYSHYLLHEGTPVRSMSFEEYEFYENHSLPFLHPKSFLHLLLNEQYEVINGQLSGLVKRIREIYRTADFDSYLDTETIQRKECLLSMLEPTTEEFQSSTIREIIKAQKDIHYVELVTKEEEQQFKTFLLMYMVLQQIRSSKDIDSNGVHFLLYVFLYHSQVFPMTSIPYSALLYSALSNSKETIFSEALTLMVEARLGIQNEALCYEEIETSSETPTELYIPITSEENINNKYRELFTFTSNRYNITVQRKPETITKIENSRNHVVWKDLREMGLPLWNKNSQLYTELALKMGMVSILLTCHHRMSTS